MKRLCLTACAVVVSLWVLPLRAADAGAQSPSQRERFAACAHDSRGMNRDERRAFMSKCLRKQPAGAAGGSAAGAAAQRRRAPCNAKADRRKLQGDERRAFVSGCLEG